MLYGTRLQFLRERLGLTQKKCGEIINVDNATYCHYEKEDVLIPTKHLITICDFLNVSLDYIFNFSDFEKYNNKQEINQILSGQRLKEFRKENKITQKKLASFLNTTQSTIAGYESGRYIIATPFLYAICKKYNISADYLLGKIDEPKYLKK